MISYQDHATLAAEPVEGSMAANTSVALTHLLASEVNQRQRRAFTCGYCGGRHVLEQRQRADGQRVFDVTAGLSAEVCCLPGEYPTPWEAATRVAVAITLGGHVHLAQRDGRID